MLEIFIAVLCIVVVCMAAHKLRAKASRDVRMLTDEQLAEEVEMDAGFCERGGIYAEEIARRKQGDVAAELPASDPIPTMAVVPPVFLAPPAHQPPT